MAGLRQKRDKWYSRILIWDGVRQKEKLIPLKTTDKELALKRHKKVLKLEPDIKDGMNFEIPWIDKCQKISIKIRYLNDYIDEFLLNSKVSINTLNSYRYALTYFIESCGKVELELINVKSIDNYKNWLLLNTKVRTSSSINIHLRGVRTFLNWCKDREYILKVPKIKMERVETNFEKYITENEFKLIMSYNYSHKRFPLMYKLYWETGMRLKEAFYGQIKGNNDNLWFDIPREFNKSKKLKTIKVNQEQADTISLIQKIWINNGCTEGHITYYSRMLTKILKFYDIKGKVFHSLRHSFALRRIVENGGNITKLCEELGHHSVTMTEVYSKFDPKRLLVDFPSLRKFVS